MDDEKETDLTEEEEVFEVEKILKMRKRNGKTQYLLKWKSFSDDEATWENEDNLLSCPEILQDFLLNRELKLEEEKKRKEMLFSPEEIRKHKPRLVIGMQEKGDEIYYRVAFHDNTYFSVKADHLRAVAPILICDFFENKIEERQND